MRQPLNYGAKTQPAGAGGGSFKLPGQDRTGLSLLLHAVVTVFLLGGSMLGGLLLIGNFFMEPSTHPGYPGVADWGNEAGILLLVIGVPLGFVRTKWVDSLTIRLTSMLLI